MNTSIQNSISGTLLESRCKTTFFETSHGSFLEDYTEEYLTSLSLPGVPSSCLQIKINLLIIFKRNFDTSAGILNGSRGLISKITSSLLEIEIINGKAKGKTILVPKMRFLFTHMSIPFQIERTQFPMHLVYATIVHKAQGQIYRYVGVY